MDLSELEEEERNSQEQELELEHEHEQREQQRQQQQQATAMTMAQVQTVLKSIFEYYSTSGAAAMRERRLTSARFQRMALDANLVDEALTTAKVDLIFSSICGLSRPYMTLQQFLDSIVRLAAAKYPAAPGQPAVLRLFSEHFASFSGSISPIFEELDRPTLLLLSQAKGVLHIFYVRQFAWECRQDSEARQGWSGSTNGKSQGAFIRGESQAAFIEFLSDFEIVPDLVPKSVAFAVFREAARVRDVPAPVQQALVERTRSKCAPPVGREFTFMHFAAALALMARKCFAEEDSCGALMHLFEWMDAANGRATFLAKYPGHAPNAAALRLLPPNSSSHSLLASGSRSSLRSSSKPAAATSSSSSAPPPYVSKCKESMSSASPGAGDLGGVIAAVGAVRAPNCSGSGKLVLAQLPPELRRLVQHLFGHYAALGDPLNRTHLSTTKFTRFLRDCGLVQAADAHNGAPPSLLDFAPGDRLQQSHSHGMLSNSSAARRHPNGPGTSIQRASLSAEKLRNASFSALSDGDDLVAGLPLQVFATPPLTNVDAELIFAKAMASAAAKDAKVSKSSPTSAGKGGTRRRNMTAEIFWRALLDIASRCFPSASQNEQTASDMLVDTVLTPLSNALPESSDRLVADADAVLAQPEARAFLQRCQPSLERIFNHYALHGPKLPLTWGSDSISKFAGDFELLAEIGQLPLQKILRDCAHYEGCTSTSKSSGTGSASNSSNKLTFAGFPYVLMLVAQKIHGSSGEASLPTLVHLLHRLNATSRAGGFAGPVSHMEALITGLSDLSSLAGSQSQLQSSCSSALNNGASGGSKSSLRSQEKMSWAQLLKGQ